MAVIPMPVLDDQKATKIAQSDKWGAISRLASIFAAGVTTLLLVPMIVWVVVTVQSTSITLTDHTRTIADVQTTVSEIRAQDGADHDALTVLKTQMQVALDQIQKLWERPAQPSKKPPP